ncbi:restriction endonuclease subunit S [Acinetobacter baumannii]|uniref:restriction endonuclease subunit S n=1 Tax=Acinetobacter baumannii TaxID=470 RepID=UPI0023409888|nr:restriction endonuclease subunit S [Acinetobacter baumannii]MDC4758488.1 restriction endonuclease subunit S [Acinetobacter baumannii]MDO7483443.1 restriction endonuclease subunit S [Acinetobacter baumannii]MDR9541864.1 restriction endonuclease subunit S [Acinetobacter baumannii]MDV7405573.1 restriction endonuclease subunit S [Acinetobacter baumannii]
MTQSNLALTENQVIPEGYKKTQVGIIPEDWIVEPLEKFTTFISYGFTNPMPTTVKGPYMLTAKDINGGKIQYREARQTSINAFNKLLTPKSKPIKNDLLLTKDGTLGRLALVEDELVCINQSVAVLRPNQRIVPKFFQILLESEYYQDQMLENAGGSTIKHIYITVVNKMLLGLPQSLAEQEKIATALSDTDALISELEKLIEKKQAIKTATMQQLLTGKTRLPEFALRDDGTPKSYKDSELGQIPEDWDAFEINEVVENIIDYRGRTPKKLGMDWGGGNIVALSAGNVRKGYIDFGAECYLGSELLYKKWMCNGEAQKDDIAFTMEAPLGNVALIPDHSKYILSQRTILLQINRQEFDPHFIFHLLMSNEFEKYISDQATGSTAQGVKRSLFEKLKLVLPIKLSEQKSISQILDDFDFEIEKLKQKLKKLQLIKQGMMQELLTGKTRLV